jgi:hypothetical protein
MAFLICINSNSRHKQRDFLAPQWSAQQVWRRLVLLLRLCLQQESFLGRLVQEQAQQGLLQQHQGSYS